MFPYKDENPTILTPIVTLGTIGVTTAVWLLVQRAGAEPTLTNTVCQLGAIPARVFGRTAEAVMTQYGPRLPCPGVGGPGWFTLVTSLFLHGGWFHLLGNMWFLWVFGNNIEDAMGHFRFAVFYLLCGVLASFVQIAVTPSSGIPLVGASGAISGIMGAYVVLYPKVRIHTIVFLGFFITRLALPAYFMLIYWAIIQLVGALPSLAGSASGGVAFLAHLGGFGVGAALIKLFTKPELLEAHVTHAPRVIVGDVRNRDWRF